MFLSIEESIAEEEHMDFMDCCTDVIVVIEEEENNGQKVLEKYIATFFSFDHINTINRQHFRSGEFLDGTYFFAKNMLLINNCSYINVRKIINHLIEEGNFKDVFKKI